jgi:hypothetical protein
MLLQWILYLEFFNEPFLAPRYFVLGTKYIDIFKFIITIHRGSSIANQIDVIRDYAHLDFEVCLSKYVRERGGFGPILVDEL